MIDSSKFRFRIGDTVKFREGNYEVKAFYFSACFNDYSGEYGYTINYPYHEGSDHSYDEYGNPLGFAEDSVYYVSEYEVEAATEERRTLEVSLEQATLWYNSNNPDLRSLALSVYTEDELTPDTYDVIASKVYNWYLCIQVPEDDASKVSVYHKLLILASYFNKGWRMKVGSIGYFIAKDNYRPKSKYTNKEVLSRKYNHRIRNHNTVIQAGIVYFKNKEDLVKAYKILGEEKIEDLFR